jgi:hypothetical protein
MNKSILIPISIILIIVIIIIVTIIIIIIIISQLIIIILLLISWDIHSKLRVINYNMMIMTMKNSETMKIARI